MFASRHSCYGKSRREFSLNSEARCRSFARGLSCDNANIPYKPGRRLVNSRASSRGKAAISRWGFSIATRSSQANFPIVNPALQSSLVRLPLVSFLFPPAPVEPKFFDSIRPGRRVPRFSSRLVPFCLIKGGVSSCFSNAFFHPANFP